jgi:hypothetical protein
MMRADAAIMLTDFVRSFALSALRSDLPDVRPDSALEDRWLDQTRSQPRIHDSPRNVRLAPNSGSIAAMHYLT